MKSIRGYLPSVLIISFILGCQSSQPESSEAPNTISVDNTSNAKMDCTKYASADDVRMKYGDPNMEPDVWSSAAYSCGVTFKTGGTSTWFGGAYTVVKTDSAKSAQWSVDQQCAPLFGYNLVPTPAGERIGTGPFCLIRMKITSACSGFLVYPHNEYVVQIQIGSQVLKGTECWLPPAFELGRLIEGRL